MSLNNLAQKILMMMENKINWKEIIRWILTIISAILAGLGTESCIKNVDVVDTLAQVINF